ncbi:SGNH/GDSL hydrolase family protein [uncultured Bacteroides sp.]|uniref:SGNH/GDSL hydrolase family protein n=1 Tax=uncultured Bacteroides sp. TaxID=162156 RepID=UPI0025F86A78|nr:SGNH/GDSL hydrolase family protein [uncultured Bacteroides sp.]
MRKNNLLPVLILLLAGLLAAPCFLARIAAQDRVPACPPLGKALKSIKPLREMHWADDTIAAPVVLPPTFRETGRNEIVDSIGLLAPVFEHLRQVRAGLSEDTVRIVHIGDSHIRGHIYPQTTGARLADVFGAVSYIDKGVNGATCLTFTHPGRIDEIAALKPELLVLSFGTNESHNRRYNANAHYNQMDELVKLLQRSMPGVPILLTTPPGSYESFRQRRRKRTYTVNPRTATATETIRRYATDCHLLVWDMYDVVGGKSRACTNWTEAGLMRPDHVHYMPEGYVLQGNLLYQAIIQAYNDYVSH